MRAANFPELKRVEEMRRIVETPREAEVGGHVMPNPTPYSRCNYCCTFYNL